MAINPTCYSTLRWILHTKLDGDESNNNGDLVNEDCDVRESNELIILPGTDRVRNYIDEPEDEVNESGLLWKSMRGAVV
jgi:hypothetical protein